MTASLASPGPKGLSTESTPDAKRARYFVYNSKEPHNIDNCSSDSNINVMVVSQQAFNARGKDARRIYEELDTSVEVVVYAKLLSAFSIPTPVGNYNPDWAIAFKSGTVKHVFFIAETKGDLSTLQLREIETSQIKCAKRFFASITSDQVKYDVVHNYEKLISLVK